MEEFIRQARVFYQKSPADDNNRLYHNRLPQPAGSDAKIGIEILFFNKTEAVCEVRLGVKFFLEVGSGKSRVWNLSESFQLPDPGSDLLFTRLCERELAPGEYVAEITLDGDNVWQSSFQIIESLDEEELPEVPFEILECKLYEAADRERHELHRIYSNQFDAAQARYIIAECNVLSKSERYLSEEIEYHFKTQKGKIVGIQKEQFSISPEDKTSNVRGSWGSPKKGGWDVDKYELQIKYKKQLLHTVEFECFEQGELPVEVVRHTVDINKYITLDPKNLKPFPDEMEDQLAVILAYKTELDKIAELIEKGQSVLISCDKILVEFLYPYICAKAGKTPSTDQSFELDKLYNQMKSLEKDQVMIFRSMEILDNPAHVFLLYHSLPGQKAQILGFKDASSNMNSVLVNRFDLHLAILNLPKRILEGEQITKGEQGLDPFQYLVTKKERACFLDDDPSLPTKQRDREFGTAMYKQVSSLNAFRFRRAMQHISTQYDKPVPYKEIFREIGMFKAKMMGDDIDIPDTKFDEIGGYQQVKEEIWRMLRFLDDRKEKKQKAPKFKGFIFHGPPGTGKTLFAKAIANELNATIQMISGPEIIDKYVGESEANLRRIFAVARRNAPSVIFFDEFDSIARKRSQSEDGGARAGNSLMAQLLTELDGFREEDGVLLIGTTNLLDHIDPALLRPSRLTPIKIDLPDTIARKRVAEIHAHDTGVDDIAKNTFSLVVKHLKKWDGANVPDTCLSEFVEAYPKLKKRMEFESERLGFRSELFDFFQFVQKIQTQYQTQNDSALMQIAEHLKVLGYKYALKLEATTPPGEVVGNLETTLTTPQQDLLSMFQLVSVLRDSKGEISADTYFSSLLNMVAEYTDGFNNDEIRAVFQEISIDCEANGQVITPRYIGQKIGLIQKKKSEKAQKS